MSEFPALISESSCQLRQTKNGILHEIRRQLSAVPIEECYYLISESSCRLPHITLPNFREQLSAVSGEACGCQGAGGSTSHIQVLIFKIKVIFTVKSNQLLVVEEDQKYFCRFVSVSFNTNIMNTLKCPLIVFKNNSPNPPREV